MAGRTSETTRPGPWELAAVAGIVVLAAWLRLRDLGLAEFKLDEATAVELARRVLDGHFATVGLVSSVGALNPPLFVYLTAIPLAVRDDPLAATAFVGVLATMAVALTWVVLRPRFGALVALSTAALLATGPWAVLFGRKLWAQNMLPLFAVSLLWSLLCVLDRPRSRAIWLVPVLLCLSFQLNFSAVVLVIPVGAVLLYRARELHLPALAIGVGVAVGLLAPWLVHEAMHGLEDVATLVAGGRGDRGSARIGTGSVEAIRHTVNLVGTGNWRYTVGDNRSQFVGDAGAAWTWGRIAGGFVTAVLAVGLVTSTARVATGVRRSGRWPFFDLEPDAARRALLLVWLGGIWLSYATSATNRVFAHYLIVAYPISFAVASLGLADLVALARGRRAATVAAFVALAAVVGGYVAFTLAYQRFLEEHRGTSGDYGEVYDDSAALARAVKARGLDADWPVIEYLANGTFDPPLGTRTLVTVRDRITDPRPLPCDHELESFGRLVACFPPADT
jgi:hypothetical protein